eukprot:tig00021525_g22122.t1
MPSLGPLLEPPTLVLFSLAVGTVIVAAKRASEFEALVRKRRDLELTVQSISSSNALMFPVLGSASLLFFFFLFHLTAIQMIITMSVCLSAGGAVAYALYPLTAYVPEGSRDTSVVSAAIGVILLWLFSGHYILNNLIGCALCIGCCSFLRLPNIKVATILLGALFFYDVFWVFYSKPLFGENVMVKVATQPTQNPAQKLAEVLKVPKALQPVAELQLPVKLIVPRDLIWADPEKGALMLGLGDIAIPGLLISYALRFESRLRGALAAGKPGTPYFRVSVGGYAVGVACAFVASFVYGVAQPALLYLVPSTLSPVLLLAWKQGDAPGMWGGSLGDSLPPEEAGEEEEDRADAESGGGGGGVGSAAGARGAAARSGAGPGRQGDREEV